ncbi:1-aminocyclopropane-1-carboxylate deaminase/D-cysteine desulfhydrase [Mucilaginibacter ginkgonis]|uniref:Pyridoxal-phosphate dependent enzyme n=1 Tax=Mucilaginibacter ginkgonis TaxID=2682091 RepID=A0A6I4I5I2_9SPHI|nr:pyridoxal-phosphate dependent enzyme [Mucilaginibacter ginkgonis]QQL48444.1 pyridoxal-phosphate dependent enzyme [Mucilaginibacter ginkgonis]
MIEFDEISSPVEQIHDDLFDAKGLKVFIKRDDMIHTFISGNKWRKLKYVLCDARQNGRNHLVTFGGAFSNHVIATAAAAAKFGFTSTGFVRGEEVTNDTLFLCRLHGMQLIFTDRESYRDKPALFEKHFGGDSKAYFIDEGGASALGARGCAEMVAEFPNVYDHIFCAAGTGTTAAGILNGLKDLPTQIHVVSALKGGEFLKDDIDGYLEGKYRYELHTDYHFGGYAKTTLELTDFIKSFIERTGILIEPVYTGKMMYAFYDMVKRDTFAPESSILAIHTGGLIGLLGMRDKF